MKIASVAFFVEAFKALLSTTDCDRLKVHLHDPTSKALTWRSIAAYLKSAYVSVREEKTNVLTTFI